MRAASSLALATAIAGAVVLGAGTSDADARPCSAADAAGASPARQERAALCLVNRERAKRDLAPLRTDRRLVRSATRRTVLMLRHDEFSHSPGPEPFARAFRAVGFRGAAAENIAWGTGSYGTARSVVRGWMRSPGHRRNILGDYRLAGVELRRGVRFQGHRGAAVWTMQYGRSG